MAANRHNIRTNRALEWYEWSGFQIGGSVTSKMIYAAYFYFPIKTDTKLFWTIFWSICQQTGLLSEKTYI
jgi:hypothetical protein